MEKAPTQFGGEEDQFPTFPGRMLMRTYLVFLASKRLGVFSKIYPESRAVSGFSKGPVAANHRQHFFDPTGLLSPIGSKKRFFSIQWTLVIVIDAVRTQQGQIRLQSPIGSKKTFFRSDRGEQRSWIEKVLTVISCNWPPGEAGNSSG